MKGKTVCPKCKNEFVMDMPDDSETTTINCPECNHLFVIKRTCNNNSDEECGWEEYGEPRKTILSSIIKKTNKPIIASFLLLATGVLGIFTAVILATYNGNTYSQIEYILSYLPDINMNIIAAIFIIFSLFAIIGSIFAFKRRYFLFAVICSVIGIFSIGLFIGLVLAIIAAILLFLSRDEFEDATKGRVF